MNLKMSNHYGGEALLLHQIENGITCVIIIEHALKKRAGPLADIKKFNAYIIINAALNNKEFPNLKLKQSVWEQ